MRKNIFLLFHITLCILLLTSCGGNVTEEDEKYIGDWHFVYSDARDGFFWKEKDVKILTLESNGDWSLDDEKASGIWGQAEDEKEAEKMKEHNGHHLLFLKDVEWKSNNAKRIENMDGFIAKNEEGIEVLCLTVNYRLFQNVLVDNANSGASVENRLGTEGLNYYFVRNKKDVSKLRKMREMKYGNSSQNQSNYDGDDYDTEEDIYDNENSFSEEEEEEAMDAAVPAEGGAVGDMDMYDEGESQDEGEAEGYGDF